jgi:uncharacterized protein (TIGR00369 family)
LVVAGKYKWTMLSALGGDMLEVKEGYARGVLPLTEAVMQPTGVFHAGAIVTLADEVASAAIHGQVWENPSASGKLFPYSIQISVNLMGNDPVGPLTAEAKVLRRGRMTVVDTTVLTHDGQTAAVMRSTHMMVNLQNQGPHQRKIAK